MIRLGVFTDEISQDFEESVKVSLENGIKDLEIRGVWGKNVGDLSEEETAKIESILSNYGVKVAVIGSPFLKCNLDRPEEYERHKKILDNCIRQAHRYETDIIRIFTFWRMEPIEKRWDNIVGRLRTHVRRAEKEGLVLAVETESSTNVGNCSELRRLLDSIPSDNLKACWDVANSYFKGEVGYPDGYRLIRGRIAHLHLKDFVLDPATGKKKHTYVGEGLIPYEALFHDLLRDGFDRVASIEAGAVHLKEKGSQAISRHVENLKNILTKVQGYP